MRSQPLRSPARRVSCTSVPHREVLSLPQTCYLPWHSGWPGSPTPSPASCRPDSSAQHEPLLLSCPGGCPARTHLPVLGSASSQSAACPSACQIQTRPAHGARACGTPNPQNPASPAPCTCGTTTADRGRRSAREAASWETRRAEQARWAGASKRAPRVLRERPDAGALGWAAQRASPAPAGFPAQGCPRRRAPLPPEGLRAGTAGPLTLRESSLRARFGLWLLPELPRSTEAPQRQRRPVQVAPEARAGAGRWACGGGRSPRPARGPPRRLRPHSRLWRTPLPALARRAPGGRWCRGCPSPEARPAPQRSQEAPAPSSRAAPRALLRARRQRRRPP